MKFLCWNTLGFDNPQGVRTLHDLLAKEDPNLVFLQETKVRTSLFSSSKFNFNFTNRLAIDCVGRSGSLAILWKNDINFKVVKYSHYHSHGEMWIMGVNEG